jgi:UDP-glucose 4-epimerase
MSRRVLITGGAGFIGHHLVRGMLADGWDVTVIDNESTGQRELVPAQAAYIKGDIRDEKKLAEAFEAKPDVVFHLAAQASNIRSFGNPVHDVEVNIGGAVKVVNKCLEFQTPKLVFAGSMTAYGMMDTLPVVEDYPLNAISYYGISKAAAERFVLATAMRPDLNAPFEATVFRMFNVYGPGQSLDNPYQGVLAIFIGNVIRGESCAIDGDGLQTRDFVYIDDVVEAWKRACAPGAAAGRSVNLGSGAQISVKQLVVETCKVLGKDPEQYPMISRPCRPGDQRYAQADITAAGRLLDWSPKIDFPEGLARTVEWALAEAKK